jgi:hypothetical protein
VISKQAMKFRLQTNVSLKLLHKMTPFQGLACGARSCAHARFITALKVQLDAISSAWRFVGMQICFKIGCTKASFIWSGLRRSRVC